MMTLTNNGKWQHEKICIGVDISLIVLPIAHTKYTYHQCTQQCNSYHINSATKMITKTTTD